MAHTIPSSTLKPNTFVYVRGNVEFSRLTRYLTDNELKEDQSRRQARGMIAIDSNYLTITVTNARIVPLDPNNVSLEEKYIAETFYKSQKNPNTMTYNAISKSNNFPKFFEPIINPDGSCNTNRCKELPISGEPVTGLDVTIVLRSFKPKRYNNIGFVVDSVIANEPMRYYDLNSAVAEFKKRGIVADELTPAEREEAISKLQNRPVTTPAHASDDTVIEAETPAQVTPPPAGTDPYSTIGNNNTNQQFMNPPVNNVTQPVNTNTMQNTQTQNTNGAWSCPVCGTAGNTGKFCSNCASAKPVTGTVTGIVFDPNSTNRNY